jgi:FAD/FMN-containing dehydrogenase
MPWTHALAFVGISGFEVRNENGKQIRPRSTGTGQSGSAQSLASDEVVANLNELTTEALAKRCQALPGGSKYHSKSGKDGMIAFIIEGGDADAEIPVETEDGDVPGQPEMEPEE